MLHEVAERGQNVLAPPSADVSLCRLVLFTKKDSAASKEAREAVIKTKLEFDGQPIVAEVGSVRIACPSRQSSVVVS